MRVHIRPGPVLGAGGLFGVMAVVVGQCTPPTPPAAAPVSGPGSGAPVPVTAPATTQPLPPDAPITTATATATAPPTTLAPSPTAAAVPPVLPSAPPTTARPIASTTPPTPAPTPQAAPPAQVAVTPPPVIVESAPPPPPAAPVTEPPPPPTEPPAPAPAQAVSAVVALVNDQRAAAGLEPLDEIGALTDAARAHSIDQATRQEMTHAGSDGSSPGDRIASAGFAASTWAENVAAGYSSPESVVQGWMGSTEHRDSIMSPAFTSIGVASAQAGDGTTYWTMNLAG